METIVKHTPKVGSKCRVIGKRREAIMYYVETRNNVHYFAKTKTDAVTAKRMPVLRTPTQAWSKYIVIEE